MTDLETADRNTLLAHHSHDVAIANRATDFDEQFVYTTTLRHAHWIDTLALLPIGVEARSGKLKQRTEQSDGLAFGQLLNSRARSIPSDIKSAIYFS